MKNKSLLLLLFLPFLLFPFCGQAQTEDLSAIVEKTLQEGKISEKPRMIFLAGPAGAGKTTLLNRLEAQGYLKISDFMHIDSDRVLVSHPKFSEYVKENPKTAAEKLFPQSLEIRNQILEKALPLRKSIVFDSWLGNVPFALKIIEKIEKEFPEYEMEIIYVTASLPTLLKRVKARGKETNRVVPKEAVEFSFKVVPPAIEILQMKLPTLTVINEDIPRIVSLFKNGFKRVLDIPLALPPKSACPYQKE